MPFEKPFNNDPAGGSAELGPAMPDAAAEDEPDAEEEYERNLYNAANEEYDHTFGEPLTENDKLKP